MRDDYFIETGEIITRKRASNTSTAPFANGPCNTRVPA